MIALYDWQKPYADLQEAILRRSRVALNTMAMGVGKTYIAIETARRLGLKLFVLCPKAVKTAWRRVAEDMGYTDGILDVVNPERIALKKTQYYDGLWHLGTEPVLLVWDEIHRGCSGADSAQTAALAKLKAYPNVRMILQSATMAESPLKMRGLGFLSGLHGFTSSSFYSWCRQNACYPSSYHRGLEFSRGVRGTEAMRRIHEQIKDLLVHATVDEIPGFPENSIEARLVDTTPEQLALVNGAYEEIRRKADGVTNPLVAGLRARQLSELAKVPMMADEINDQVEAGNSVVVFQCFHDSMDALKSMLKVPAVVIDGRRSESVRVQSVDTFQADDAPVCLAQIASGGVGVSLHAIRSDSRPRVSYICPSYSASEVTQACGRIWRAGSYHKAVQNIILLAGSIETDVYSAVNRKSGNLSAFTDADFGG